jgi:hypothetical protein
MRGTAQEGTKDRMTSQRPIQRRNKRPGTCEVCAQHVPVGTGVVTKIRSGWRLTHPPKRWVGSPVNGRWVDGCPPGDQPGHQLGGADGVIDVVIDVETETRVRIARLHSADAPSTAHTGHPDSPVDYTMPEVVTLSHMTIHDLIADPAAAALLIEIADQEGWS